jgi:hypothetical protein
MYHDEPDVPSMMASALHVGGVPQFKATAHGSSPKSSKVEPRKQFAERFSRLTDR